MTNVLGRLDPRDYRALAHFRHLIRRFLAFSEEAARDVGLEPQQHQLLLAIKGMSAGVLPTVGALAAALQIRHHSAVELLSRLEKRGHVRRSRSTPDRRQVLAQITPAGERILRKLSIRHREELRRLGPRLLEALSALLNGAPLPEESLEPPRRPPRSAARRRSDY